MECNVIINMFTFRLGLNAGYVQFEMFYEVVFIELLLIDTAFLYHMNCRIARMAVVIE